MLDQNSATVEAAPPNRFRRRPPPQPHGQVDPSWLVLLFAVAVAITPEFNFLGIPKVRITDLLLPVILVAYLGSLSSKKTHGERLPLIGLMTCVLAWDFTVLFVLGQGQNMSNGVLYLGKRVSYFLIFLMGMALVRSAPRWERIVWALVAAAPFLSFSVLYEQANRGGADEVRASGIIQAQQTSTALFILVVLSLVIGLWPAARRGTHRLLMILAAGSGVMAALATGSKTAVLILGLLLVILVFRGGKEAFGLILILVASVGFGWMLTPGAVQERILRIQTETGTAIEGLTSGTYEGEAGGDSLADRYYMAKGAWNHLIPQNPIIGLGTAHVRLGAIDNFYISEWVYHGLIGLLLWTALMLQAARLLLVTAGRAENPLERATAMGALIALLVMALSAFVADSFYLIRPMEALMLLLGLALGRGLGSSAQAPRPRARPG